MKSFATCDLCDTHEEKLADGSLIVFPPVFHPFGKQIAFAGPAATLKVFEDNVLVRAALETAGAGRVLVIDGGASLRCALVGGNLAAAAAKNGWAGIVVNGAVRDLVELRQSMIGIRALALMPLRTAKRDEGQAGEPVQIQGVWVRPGDWLYADEDGIVVGATALV